MDATQATYGRPEHPEPALDEDFGAGRLIGGGLAWVFAALLATVVVRACAGFLIGFGASLAGVHLSKAWFHAHGGYFVLLGGIGLQSVLLAGALRRGRLVGKGDRAAGLGINAIRRPVLVTGLIGLLVCCQIAVIALMRHVGAMPRSAPAISGYQLAGLGLTIAMASIVEDLFFRGWLWVGLRRLWGTAPVMVVTAISWLGIHVFDGIYRPLWLIPFAVCLAIIRQVGGSVRASIAGHIAGNAVVFGWLLIELYWR